ncbi:MAG: 2TM domain-containing protein [Flavobacteriaceae bacterium]|nr:2TM domain-containing protein [Flavobacteriaceae bacterium]
MEQNYLKEQNYIRAKKRVKDIKGFYVHLIVFIAVNIFLSIIIIYGLMQSGASFFDAITHFGTYSTALFWGIGLFFHWLGVFGFKSLGLGKNWEDRKIKEFMEKEDETYKRLNRK